MQMLRIFHGTRKDSIYWAILIVIWSNFIFYVTFTICEVVACVPRAKLTNPELSGRCINNYASILATSAISVASDFSILLLPVFAVWKLKIALRRKLIISAVFGMGLLWVPILPRQNRTLTWRVVRAFRASYVWSTACT